jgi:transcription antitermination factor NusG
MQNQGYESLSNQIEATSWYAVYTRHQHEKLVAQSLSNKGFDVFLPLYSAIHRWKDREKQLLVPLFPCYVFLSASLERRLDVLTTPGVHDLVSSAGRPIAIPENEIHAVRQLVERSRRVEPHPFLHAGDWVRVKSGPLMDVEGILVRKKNEYRLVVSIEMLGKSAAAEVDASTVERISSPHSRSSLYPSASVSWAAA